MRHQIVRPSVFPACADDKMLKCAKLFSNLSDIHSENTQCTVMLITMMWDEISEDNGIMFKTILQEGHWKAILNAESRMIHFHATYESAWEITKLLRIHHKLE
jgi:hypothetical protein